MMKIDVLMALMETVAACGDGVSVGDDTGC